MQIVRTNYPFQQVADSLSKIEEPQITLQYRRGSGYIGHTSIAFPDAAKLQSAFDFWKLWIAKTRAHASWRDWTTSAGLYIVYIYTLYTTHNRDRDLCFS